MLLGFALHWAVPVKLRRFVDLALSICFYAAFGADMLVVLCAGCVLSYFGALALSKTSKKWVLFLAVIAALLPLCFFKYAPTAGFKIFYPIGISFYTFKILSYLIEVWRKTLPAERSFINYALYICIFPEITSGPIQRPASLLNQINAPAAFDAEKALDGGRIFIWGLFLKSAIADNLAFYVETAFVKTSLVIGPSVLIGMVLYSLQIYADFAGYSYMAKGCMQLLGYDAPDNFKSPYFSKSIKEFWARWHITLSEFLRDYVYFPLGGSRCGMLRRCVNLAVTFFVSGLWHGTGLGFIVWGLLHGAYQIIGVLTKNLRAALWKMTHISEQSAFAKIVKVLCTFALVTFAWVFFGASSYGHAIDLFAKIPDCFSLSPQTLKNALVMLGLTPAVLLRIVPCLALMAGVDFFARADGVSTWLGARKTWLRCVILYAAIFAILFIAPPSGGGFIYFEF
jgi:alginate O-acetyltransferase complex protein AlgI